MGRYVLDENAIRDVMSGTAPEDEQTYLQIYHSLVDLWEAAWWAGRKNTPLEKAIPIVRRKRQGEQ